MSASTWGIAINRGKPIGENAMLNHPNPRVKRATLLYGHGRLTIEHLNNIGEAQRPIDWAIGGVGLYPSFDPDYEKVPKDILRCTQHTGMAFKGSTVYLIVSHRCSMHEFRNRIRKLDIDGALALDGGGSTQMYWKGNRGIHSSRKLNNMVGVKL